MRAKNYPAFSEQVKTASFNLDEEQVAKANKWMVTHRCSRAGQYGSAGDKIEFRFGPSAIGDFVSLHCSCGKSVDLTGNL